MAYSGQGQKVQKVMVQPINLIFRYLQNRSRIQVWLYEQVNLQIEGCIIGFDEYMNLLGSCGHPEEKKWAIMIICPSTRVNGQWVL
uniref:Small nuclear ribonucleoprotein E n=1 Tax=Gorilla gorilla gorilla TaxID=9595 RepID=G3RT30_GORGO